MYIAMLRLYVLYEMYCTITTRAMDAVMHTIGLESGTHSTYCRVMSHLLMLHLVDGLPAQLHQTVPHLHPSLGGDEQAMESAQIASTSHSCLYTALVVNNCIVSNM